MTNECLQRLTKAAAAKPNGNAANVRAADLGALIAEWAIMRLEIKAVLTENAHLADGEICTLIKLKRLVPEWESEFLANGPVSNAAGETPRHL